jgi:thioredoxin-related protein
MKIRLIPFSILSAASLALVLSSCKKETAGAPKAPAAAQEVEGSKTSPAVWLTDYEAAKAEALKSGKILLIDFTGSDWCPYCIKLHDEVFQYNAFKEGVEGRYVLLKVDVPNDKSKQPAATIEQNAKLVEIYGAQVFPMILLADANGIPFASTSYHEGGPKKYVALLNELALNRKIRDDNFAAAAKVEGPEKAKLLFAALEKMNLREEQAAIFYGDTMEQIRKSDPQDESGYAKKEAAKERLKQFEKDVNAFAAKEDLPGAITFIDKTLADGGMSAEDTQQVIVMKALVLNEMAKYEEAVRVVDDARKVAPDSETAANLDQIVKQIEERKAKGGAKE